MKKVLPLVYKRVVSTLSGTLEPDANMSEAARIFFSYAVISQACHVPNQTITYQRYQDYNRPVEVICIYSTIVF